MPCRILLISTNRCAVPDPVFPLGLAYLSAALRQAGHTVRWFDQQAATEPLEAALAEFKPHLAGISIRNIDDVLIRKQETYYDSLGNLCQLVKDHAGCPVVLGGSGFSIFPHELLEISGADYGIRGAGEGPCVSLVAALEAGREPVGIPGLVTRAGDRDRERRPSLPPAHAGPACPGDRPQPLVDFYLRAGCMLNVQTQRGCGCLCTYCTYPLIEGRAHDRRAADLVAEEFDQVARLGGKYVFIVDSVFNSSVRHVVEVCEALLRRGNAVNWGCFLRPQGLTPDLMKLMARAGLRHIEFGSDSFHDDVLRSYQKGFTFEDIRHSSELARAEKLDQCHFIILGGPGETLETIKRGFENSRMLKNAVIMAVVGMRIYPGTSLHARAMAEGRLAANANLLKPSYYVAQGLSADRIFQELNGHAHAAPNWIAGDPASGYAALVARLRKRGVAGPLWSYLSMIQRVWPAGPPALPGCPTPAASS